ncbi:threonine/homoserine/homoserine lactone efflux protein [Planomicrobium soli]|uniref:Threonine/homoserine/homoserine lactone efflux protein n=1 Tax=Planomicrobium soli TaxID=1176648 RepID=A0A2P8H5I3_9BACL|nr:LysE family translocator [Planomicrobium soli]PSL41449.1 threonine/homoserine/homoserine lactone efflux protein [Planomicrobium soli]
MEFLSITAFLGAAVLLTLMPGPDNLFVLAQSIAKGQKAGVSTSLGLCTGLLFHITAATVGLSALVYQSAFAFALVKYVGAAYLLFLAYKSFREKSSGFDLSSESSLSYKALYKRGVIMNLLNPKVSLFFLALFPQFINYSWGNVPGQMLIYGLIFLLQALVIFSLISVFAGSISAFLQKSPSISKRINKVQGTLFALIAFNIAFSQK